MFYLNGVNTFLDGNNYLYDISDTALNIINTIQTTDGVILTEAQVNYVWYIVDSLIAEGIWDKIKALYGFVGGTAATHKWNWKDMRNLDDAFRLTFVGAFTHSSNGVQLFASNAYANKHITSNEVFSTSVGKTTIIYSNIAPINSTLNILSGALMENSSPIKSSQVIDRNNNFGMNLGNRSVSLMSMPNNIGLSIHSVKTSDGYSIKNGNIVNTTLNMPNNDIPNIKEYLFNRNHIDATGNSIVSTSSRWDGRLCFYSDSEFITQQEAIILSNIITTAQKILNRA